MILTGSGKLGPIVVAPSHLVLEKRYRRYNKLTYMCPITIKIHSKSETYETQEQVRDNWSNFGGCQRRRRYQGDNNVQGHAVIRVHERISVKFGPR